MKVTIYVEDENGRICKVVGAMTLMSELTCDGMSYADISELPRDLTGDQYHLVNIYLNKLQAAMVIDEERPISQETHDTVVRRLSSAITTLTETNNVLHRALDGVCDWCGERTGRYFAHDEMETLFVLANTDADFITGCVEGDEFVIEPVAPILEALITTELIRSEYTPPEPGDE